MTSPWTDAIASTSRDRFVSESFAGAHLAKFGSAQACLDFCKKHPGALKDAHPSANLLQIALQGGRFDLAIDLLALGALAPESHARSQNPDGDLRALLARHCSCPSFFKRAHLALEKSGRAAPSWSQWISACLDQGNLLLGLDIAHAHGAKPLDEDIERLRGQFMTSIRSRALPSPGARAAGELGQPHSESAQALSQLLDLWGKALPGDFVQGLWTKACDEENLGLAGWLAARELFPSPWIATEGFLSRQGTALGQGLSLLGLASARAGSTLFQTLLRDPRAVAAATQAPPPPRFCLGVSSAHLVAMHRAGVPVLMPGPDGRNVLHCWADFDQDKPRDGWRAVAKMRPDMLDERDASGRTPVEIQTLSLKGHPKRQDGFAQMIAGIERKQLDNAASPAPATKAPRKAL